MTMGDNTQIHHLASNGHENTSTSYVEGESTSNYDWLLFLVNATMMLSSLAANVSVIYFICGQKKARTTPNITVVSIAVADILSSVFVVPTYFALTKYALIHRDIAPYVCKLNVYVWYWCKTVTIYSVAAMVCDRYNCYMKPFKTSNTSGRFMFFLSFVWFFGAAYNIWEIVLNDSITVQVTLEDVNVTIKRCSLSPQFRYLNDGFMTVDFLVIFILPFIVIIFFFISISYRILHPDERIITRQTLTGRRRLAMSATIFCLFYICQLPYEVLESFIHITSTFPANFAYIIQLLKTLSFSQSFLNVIAYACCSTELHRVIRKRYHRHRIIRGTSPTLMSTNLQIPDIILTEDVQTHSVAVQTSP